MRILFVTEDYPPLVSGGYAQLCYDIAHGLRGKGHDVTILCSATRSGLQVRETERVSRILHYPIVFQSQLPIPLQQIVWTGARRRRNLTTFHKILQDYQIETILFWPNLLLDSGLMVEAERTAGLTVAYYLAGHSPTQPTALELYWSHPGHSRLVQLAKAVLRRFMTDKGPSGACLAMQHVMCVSNYERQRVIAHRVEPDNALVVHNGIDPDRFRYRGLPSTYRRSRDPLKVLYLGRLVQTKGAHIVVEAIRLCRQNHPNVEMRLTILGSGDEHYVRLLEQKIAAHDLNASARLCSWVERDAIPAVMSQHDVLVLPTIHDEPLARAVQEAMAMGLVVVATPTGGTPEIVRDGITGLLFAPDKPSELAMHLLRLHADSDLADRLASAARALVEREFTIQKTVDRVEGLLQLWRNSDTPVRA